MRISDWSSDVCSSDLARAAGDFRTWVAARGVTSLGAVQPLHVGAWIEALGGEMSAPSVKQQLAGVRRLFDWLVIGQVMPVNPAASRSEEHTSELQSLMRISYAVFCLKKKTSKQKLKTTHIH